MMEPMPGHDTKHGFGQIIENEPKRNVEDRAEIDPRSLQRVRIAGCENDTTHK
jgi:hypothetical protein